jgi:hypothetical protein
MAANEASRGEKFDEWWKGGFPAFSVTATLEDRIASAFRSVFTKMADVDREVFLGEYPTIVCVEGVRAAVSCLRVWTVDSSSPTVVAVIYLNADALARGTDANLRNTIAHEAAHIVRGDHKRTGIREGEDVESEAAADALSVSWGYRACYSPARLARLRGTSSPAD